MRIQTPPGSLQERADGEAEAYHIGNSIVAVPTSKILNEERVRQVQRLARRHIQLQARHLAADLEVELRSRAKAAHMAAEESAKNHRLAVREAMANEEKDRRLQEQNEHADHVMARAQYLEWATAAERLHRQDEIAQRRFEASLVRAAERDRLAALQQARDAETAERLRVHEESLQTFRVQKAMRYDAKLDRIAAMEANRDEIYNEVKLARLDASKTYDELKELAHESAVWNNDDTLRRLLEDLVPRLAPFAHTQRSDFYPRRSARNSARSISPKRNQLAESFDDVYKGRSQEIGRPATARRAYSCRAPVAMPLETAPRAMENPARLVGIGGIAPRPVSVKQSPRKDKAGNESRSTSATSLGNSAVFSASHGSFTGWDAISLPSPAAPELRLSVMNQSVQSVPSTIKPASASATESIVDCPLCYTTPRRPLRGIELDLSTYANTARGLTESVQPVQVGR
jgi:hypothetical protein